MQLRKFMADPANGETYAEDDDAMALLAEAEALIEGAGAEAVILKA